MSEGELVKKFDAFIIKNENRYESVFQIYTPIVVEAAKRSILGGNWAYISGAAVILVRCISLTMEQEIRELFEMYISEKDYCDMLANKLGEIFENFIFSVSWMSSNSWRVSFVKK